MKISDLIMGKIKWHVEQAKNVKKRNHIYKNNKGKLKKEKNEKQKNNISKIIYIITDLLNYKDYYRLSINFINSFLQF